MDIKAQNNSPENGPDQQADPSLQRNAMTTDIAGVLRRPISMLPPRQWTLERIEAAIGSIA